MKFKPARGCRSTGRPDCSKACIEKGAGPRSSPSNRTPFFNVVDSDSIIDDLGYQVEVGAAVDSVARTVRIIEVKQLSFDGAAVRPPVQEVKRLGSARQAYAARQSNVRKLGRSA